MAKRSGFKFLVDNESITYTNLNGTIGYVATVSAETARRAATQARDLMIKRIADESQDSDYSKYREGMGVSKPNYYHSDSGGSYDSVTRAIVVFDNFDKDLRGGSDRFTMGVGARQRGKGSVQNNYMPAALALELIDQGFENSQGLVPLTHGREQIKSHWAVNKVPGKHFTAGVQDEMYTYLQSDLRRAEVVIQGKFAKGYTGPTSGAEWEQAARKYYRSLRNDGGYDVE